MAAENDIPKQVDAKTATFRLMHVSPGHVVYGVWINGGKCGELTVRAEERMAFQGMMARGGFRFAD